MDEDSGENTVSIVNNMLQRRRRLRLGIALSSAALLGLLAYMVLHLGSPDKGVFADGPVSPGHASEGTEASPPPSPPPGEGAKAAAAATAAPGTDQDEAHRVPAGLVEVVVDFPSTQGQLWANGRLLGTDQHQVLHLKPGKHTLMLKNSSRILVQKLFVDAGDLPFHVEFGQKARVTRQLR